MLVTVEYHAQIKQAAGVASEQVEMPAGSTVQDLVGQLAVRHADLRPLLLQETGTLRPSILLFVGEEQARWRQPRVLHDGETVVIMSPIAGG